MRCLRGAASATDAAPARAPPRARRLARELLQKRLVREQKRGEQTPPGWLAAEQPSLPSLLLMHGAAAEACTDLDESAASAPPRLLERSSRHAGELLPFAVHHRCASDVKGLTLDALRGEVALRQEMVVGSDGRSLVEESRLTAFLSDVGASFSYSGKEMHSAGPMPPLVAAVRDALDVQFGVRFDSVLVNFYKDGKAGMKFHCDPQADGWADDTAVVSVGAARRFVLRRIDDVASRWTHVLHTGDVVYMSGDCQRRFQHAVPAEKEARAAGERISLVFKKRRPAVM